MATLERVKTEDGLELHGLLYEPESKTDSVILHCHGMAGNFYENRFVNIVGLKLVSQNISFCAMNNRGHDFQADFIVEKDGKVENKRIGEVYERVEDSVKDISAWINFLKQKGYSKIILMGHSLGAVKAILYLKNNQSELKSLILASPPDMYALAKQDGDCDEKLKEAKELVEKGEENKLLSTKVYSWYPISAGTYLNLCTKDSPADIFSIESGRDPKEVQNVTLPTLVVYGEIDDCFNYDSEGISKFFETNLKTMKLKVLPKADHTYLNEEETFAQTVLDFAKDQGL